MKNAYLNNIKSELVRKLNAQYGFCGVMDSDNISILNSGTGAEDYWRVK